MVMFVDMSLGEKFVVLAACSLLLILHFIVYFFGNVKKNEKKEKVYGDWHQKKF